MVILQKEHSDDKVIDSVFRKITENGAKELKIHLVYASRYYYWYDAKLRTSILKRMKKYNIKSVMVTIINMLRAKVITQEEMKRYCDGEYHRKYSVNDDLESVYEDLRLGKEPGAGAAIYFLPKLTDKELEMIERKDTTYFKTFHESDPVKEFPLDKLTDKELEIIERSRPVSTLKTGMKLSETDSKNMKFVKGYGFRKSFTIEN